jgi:hypothetical protein
MPPNRSYNGMSDSTSAKSFTSRGGPLPGTAGSWQPMTPAQEFGGRGTIPAAAASSVEEGGTVKSV